MPTLLPPNIAKFGEVALVEITFFVSPFAQDASILMSSPAPVGMFLICNAAITEPPHLVEGWPEGSDGPKGTKPVKSPAVKAAWLATERPVGRPLKPRAL